MAVTPKSAGLTGEWPARESAAKTNFAAAMSL